MQMFIAAPFSLAHYTRGESGDGRFCLRTAVGVHKDRECRQCDRSLNAFVSGMVADSGTYVSVDNAVADSSNMASHGTPYQVLPDDVRRAHLAANLYDYRVNNTLPIPHVDQTMQFMQQM